MRWDGTALKPRRAFFPLFGVNLSVYPTTIACAIHVLTANVNIWTRFERTTDNLIVIDCRAPVGYDWWAHYVVPQSNHCHMGIINSTRKIIFFSL